MSLAATGCAGSIAVVDLEAVCEAGGHYRVPSPLGRSRPVGSVWLATRERPAVDDVFLSWVDAYSAADICVACRTHDQADEAADVRIHALRSGETGFLAVQCADPDAIDIVDLYRVSALELTSGIVDRLELTTPGSRPAIVVPGHLRRFGILVEARDDGRDDRDIRSSIPVRSEGRSATTVSADDVVTVTTIRTAIGPGDGQESKSEGTVLAWLQVRGDGDYLYSTDFSYAEPMSRENLCRRIDQMIARAVAVLRNQRSER